MGQGEGNEQLRENMPICFTWGHTFQSSNAHRILGNNLIPPWKFPFSIEQNVSNYQTTANFRVWEGEKRKRWETNFIIWRLMSNEVSIWTIPLNIQSLIAHSSWWCSYFIIQIYSSKRHWRRYGSCHGWVLIGVVSGWHDIRRRSVNSHLVIWTLIYGRPNIDWLTIERLLKFSTKI